MRYYQYPRRDTPRAHRCQQPGQTQPETAGKTIKSRSPLAPLKKGGTGVFSLVPLLKGGTGAGLFHSLVGAVPRVPAQRSETHTKSWTKRVGTGALPLQNDDLSENETALGTGVFSKSPFLRGGQESDQSPPS